MRLIYESNVKDTLSDLVDSEPLVQDILKQLDSQLDPELHYHSAAHTKMVINRSIELALDGLADRDILLIGIAAAFHDAVFLEQGQITNGSAQASEKGHAELQSFLY